MVGQRALRTGLAIMCASGVVAGGVMLACSGTSDTETITPITGITVRAETLTTGRGCGTAPGQIFKFAAVVFGRDAHAASGATDPNDPSVFDDVVTAQLYDCFTDGTFVSLPVVGGSSQFRVEVYAWDAQAFAANSGAIATTVDALSRAQDISGNRPPAATYDAPADVDSLRTLKPTVTTTCGATQLPNVQVIAVCGPVLAGNEGITNVAPPPTPPVIVLDTRAFDLEDGGTIACLADLDAGSSADADADADADVDAEAAAPPAPPLSFLGVHVLTTNKFDASVGAAVDVQCPAQARIDVSADDNFATPYTLEVTLQDPSGRNVAQTTCTADRSDGGADLPARCKPATLD